MNTADSDSSETEEALLEAWRTQVSRELGGAGAASLSKQTLAGLTVEPLAVGRADLDLSALRSESPAPWRVVVRLDAADPSRAAEQVRQAVASGADEITLEAGPEHGVRLLSAGDLAHVLEPLDLSRQHVSFTPRGDGLGLASALLAVAQARGVSREALRGGFGVDPLGTLAAKGSLPSGVRGALREALALAHFTRAELPGMRALCVDVTPYHEAGAHAVSQLGWALSSGLTYLRALTESGMSVDEASSSLAFCLPVTGELLPEMAKLRAARLLWAKVVSAAGGGPEAQRMALCARGATRTRSRRDRFTNMVRASMEITAAALGGADSIESPPFDVACGGGDEQARRTALRAHHVLREEAHLCRVRDPLAGSYALETHTASLARAAWDEMRDVEGRGGMFAELRGRVRRTTRFTTESRWRQLSTRRRAVVGVSRFANLEESAPPKPPVEGEEWFHELGRRLTDKTPIETQAALLDWARLLAQSDLAPLDLGGAAVQAIEAGVDLYSLRALLDEGRPSFHIEPLHGWRDAEGFEAFRDESDRWLGRRGSRPRVLLLTLGALADYDARASFLEELLAAGGVEAVRRPFATDLAPADLEDAVADTQVLCGADADYAGLGIESVRDLFTRGLTLVGRVGAPTDDAEAWQSAGVVHSFHQGADAIAMLGSLWESFGDVP